MSSATAPSAATSIASDHKKPKIICVGTGRDGSLSTADMIQSIFDRSDGRLAIHEYRARDFYQSFCDFKETGSEKFADQIREMITQCPADCIVGNGYAAVLPFFRECWGPETRLLHLRRRDRDACIASLMKNCEMFPLAYCYYTSNPDARIKRIAAFHFGEMTRSEWERAPATVKFGWYYDKTHQLIDQYSSLFSETMEVLTEELSQDAGRRRIANFVCGDGAVAPEATRLNAHSFDLIDVPPEQRFKASWLLGRLNWDRLVTDECYGLDYFSNKFCAWTGYQITGAPQLGDSRIPSSQEMATILSRARAILAKALEEVDGLTKLNSDTALRGREPNG